MNISGINIFMAISLSFFLFVDKMYGQQADNINYTEIDSLSSYKDIKLRPEVMDVINRGDLINFDKPLTNRKLNISSYEIEISKDFHEYITPNDTVLKKIDITKLPPSVFMLYFNDPIQIIEYRSFSLAGIDNYKSERPVPILITDPLSKGQASGGVRYIVNISNLIDYYILGNKHKH